MPKYFLSLFLACLLLICFSQNRNRNNNQRPIESFTAAEELFRRAEKLSADAGINDSLQAQADEVYHKALANFHKLIRDIENTGNDSLVFFARLRTGFIEFYLDSQAAAKRDYLAAIGLKQRLPSVPDSVLFLPFLYTGGIYYSQNEFDSALTFYKKAEMVNDQYKKSLAGSERLYNRLGVMYYENGNYRQARNYFEKAITLTRPGDTSLLINYKINMASLLVKLEEYPKAMAVYQGLLLQHILPDEINHNLGIICLKQKDYKKAIGYLDHVHYNNSKKSIDLYLNFGEAWSGLNEEDSSLFYVQRAVAENTKWNGNKKNIPFGLVLNFQAGQLMKQHRYDQAIGMYQQAIMQFDAGFYETDIFKNPEEFSGVFSYINLFNALVAKADALELLYREQPEIKLLELSFATYRAAFKLADHVEKTYDSDEARLFLGRLKYTAHSKPIDVSLLLHKLTQNNDYLEEAYHFDQQNKASVLSLNIQENDLKNSSASNKDLFEKERSLKSAITRLTLKSAQLTDSLDLQTTQAMIRDDEIELGKLQEVLNNDPAYRSRYFTSQIPSVRELQKKLDNTTALLSWHLSAQGLVVFVITGNRFSYYDKAINVDFLKKIDSFKTALQNTSTEQRYHGAGVSTDLYNSLMAPVESKLSNMERLIIIPDDELIYLPFEALEDENGRYLAEKFSIQYQYSTALLGKEDKSGKAGGTLAFAPFVSKGFTDSSGDRFSVLQASGRETSGLPGKIFTDSSALKENFLSSANHYGIIHLATHASVDNKMPLRSYIAFYPAAGKTPEEFKLYAQEIYNLRLDSTEIVILSACETGAGKLVKGEGLMSLSRAFAYAGCPNIITSLWKAEDNATAFIIQKFHAYIKKEYSIDKALQQAKLDLLKSDDIDPRYKTPNFWAHLVFVGDYTPAFHTINWWWIAIGIILAAITYIIVTRRTLARRKRV